MKATLIQRWVSYLFPIVLKKIRKNSSKPLKILLYKGQLQLVYGRVFYSDGIDYFPFRKAFTKIGNSVSDFNKILILGSGIGSIVMILEELYVNTNRQYDIVDLDEDIIYLCQANLSKYHHLQSQYHIEDAIQFIQQSKKQYDFVGVDVFNEHIVPKQILEEKFLQRLKNSLQPKGFAVLNMMFHTKMQQTRFEHLLQYLFNYIDVISTRKNKIYIVKR